MGSSLCRRSLRLARFTVIWYSEFCKLFIFRINMFGGTDCSMHSRIHRQVKSHPEQRECSSINGMTTSKLIHPSEAVMYTGPSNMHDNRMVWATLTRRGTQHFISQNYPRNLMDYAEPEDHYEAIDQPVSTVNYSPCQKGLDSMELSRKHAGIDNCGFTDYDYEDPMPLIESNQLNTMENREDAQYYATLGNTDMRCTSLGSSCRREVPHNFPLRPRVSSPTRIEHPNLPPLNLYPHKGANMIMTLKRNGTLSYRNNDNIVYRTNDNLLPKYGC